MMIVVVVLIIGGVLVGTYLLYRQYQNNNVRKDLEELLEKGAIILDVRTPEEYADSHMKGAVNVALSRLNDEDLPLEKDQIYIVCCSHGLRSIQAMEILRSRGYTNIYDGGKCSELEKLIK